MISTYLLIVVGGWVRATGSGLGCPDWPLCHGQPLPPAAPAPLIEFSHRSLAGATTALVVTASALILRMQTPPRLRILAVIVPILLAGQIGVGAATVLLELPPPVVTGHLALAFLLLGMLVAEAIMLRPASVESGHAADSESTQEIRRLTLVAAGAVYVEALLGGIVRGSGASLACTGFPLCNGEVVPSTLTTPVALHLLHRAGALIVLGLLAYTLFKTRTALPGSSLDRWSGAAFILALLQGAIGVFAVTAFLPPVVQVLHVAGAAATWATTIALAVQARRTREPARLVQAASR